MSMHFCYEHPEPIVFDGPQLNADCPVCEEVKELKDTIEDLEEEIRLVDVDT